MSGAHANRRDRFVPEPAPARLGRPPALTPEQDAEIYDAFRLRATLTNRALSERYGVSEAALMFALNRESTRRANARRRA
jgi:hypothetical protein